MGYETHNSLLNLGSVTILILLYFLVLIFMGFIKIIVKLTGGYGTSIYNSIKKCLIFDMLISLFMEPYMELLISAYLNIKAPLFSKNGEIIGTYTGYIAAAGSCVILPFTYLWV